MGVFAYHDADTDATLYYVVPSPGSDRPASTVDYFESSDSTGTTIESDDLPGYFVLHHGRQQPASENLAKFFPTDNIRRYVLHYLVPKSIFDGDHDGPVREILAPTTSRTLQVLELGTRTGTWVQSMASEFPHVQFRSLDIIPIIPHTPRLNVIFEVYDFTKRIILEDESQDAVFLNFVIERVRDFPALIREVHRVLRPGGLVHFCDYSPHPWDPDNLSVHSSLKSPAACRHSHLMCQQALTVGVDMNAVEKISGWLAPNSGLWGSEQDRKAGFEQIGTVMRTYPMFPHEGYPCASLVQPGIIPFIRYLTASSTRDTFSVLRDIGIEEAEAERMIEEVLEELKRHESCSLVKMYRIHALKV